MTVFFPSHADMQKYMRTHMVITEELPYKNASGSYLSYWVFKPYAADENTGSVHQYLVRFHKSMATSETEITEETHKNLSREDAIRLLLKAECEDLANNRERVDISVEPYAKIIQALRYADIPYAPLPEALQKVTDSIIQKAVFPTTSAHVKLRKAKPKL